MLHSGSQRRRLLWLQIGGEADLLLVQSKGVKSMNKYDKGASNYERIFFKNDYQSENLILQDLCNSAQRDCPALSSSLFFLVIAALELNRIESFLWSLNWIQLKGFFWSKWLCWMFLGPAILGQPSQKVTSNSKIPNA